MEDMAEKIKELEKNLADLRKRLPAHSVKPHMLQEIEKLEEELERLTETKKQSL
ncbi:MAG: histidine kinase [Eubacteriales bacterium]